MCINIVPYRACLLPHIRIRFHTNEWYGNDPQVIVSIRDFVGCGRSVSRIRKGYKSVTLQPPRQSRHPYKIMVWLVCIYRTKQSDLILLVEMIQ